MLGVCSVDVCQLVWIHFLDPLLDTLLFALGYPACLLYVKHSKFMVVCPLGEVFYLAANTSYAYV